MKMILALTILIGFTAQAQRISVEDFVPANQPLIVFTGESNSGGQALNADALPGEIGERPEVLIMQNITLRFTNLNIGVNNNLGHQGMSVVNQLLWHGWELQLANRIDTGTLGLPFIRIVKTGMGGSVIDNWGVDSFFQTVSPWAKFQERVDRALYYTRNIGDNKFVIFYSQGINDASDAGWNPTTWKTKTKAHFDKIRAKYGNVPIIMTKFMTTTTNAAALNTAVEEICAEYTNCYFVEGSNDVDDSKHWSYEGMKVMSDRLVNKAIEIGYLQ